VSIAALGAGIVSSEAANRRSAGTTEHIFSPFNGGSPATGLQIAKTIRGSCWTGSEGTARSDAWRCMSGNYIYDPCFSDHSGTAQSYVICAGSPFSRKVLRFVLTKALPYKYSNKDGDPTRFIPWAVRLSSGATCVNIQGATGAIAGMRIGYSCSNKGVLVGSPKRSGAMWHIFFAPRYGSSNLTLVPIPQAWW
jgi:hypothetical protein